VKSIRNETIAKRFEMASRASDRDVANTNIGRGTELKLILQYEWLARNKGMLTPMESRIKQAVWDWFSTLQGAELQKVCPAVPPPPLPRDRAKEGDCARWRDMSDTQRYLACQSEHRHCVSSRAIPESRMMWANRMGFATGRSRCWCPRWSFLLHFFCLQVLTVVDKSWLDVLFSLDRIAQKKSKDGE
jgi:hypothetical protein